MLSVAVVLKRGRCEVKMYYFPEAVDALAHGVKSTIVNNAGAGGLLKDVKSALKMLHDL